MNEKYLRELAELVDGLTDKDICPEDGARLLAKLLDAVPILVSQIINLQQALLEINPSTPPTTRRLQ
jgi:hypothetical protein